MTEHFTDILDMKNYSYEIVIYKDLLIINQPGNPNTHSLCYSKSKFSIYEYNLFYENFDSKTKLIIPANFLFAPIYLANYEKKKIKILLNKDEGSSKVNVYLTMKSDFYDFTINFAGNL